MSNVNFQKIVSIEELPPDDDWVYDIEMSDRSKPYFFGNNILVHNSCYFNTKASNTTDATIIANNVADVVNASFSPFMIKTFLCDEPHSKHISSTREVIMDRGIFVDKKRYIIHLVDLNGRPVDKMKVMGLDTKKTTLPVAVAKTINHFVERFLKGEDWDDLASEIVDYKQRLANSQNILDIGLPKGVDNVEDYTMKYAQDRTCRLPGHVAASIHYNELLKRYRDKHSLPITSGMKIKVFYVKGDHGKFKSIAIPTDMDVAPAWFLDNYVVDIKAHMDRLVDNPLSNIIKAIGKTAPTTQSVLVSEMFEF